MKQKPDEAEKGRHMKQFSKKTLENSWFWVCVGILVSVCVTQFALGTHREHEEIRSEFALNCPDGFIGWENSEFEVTGKFEGNGDSLIDFEKRTESGCRPFDFTGVPRAAVDSLIVAHSVVHYTWVQGRMNLSKGVLLWADSTHSTNSRKYR